MGSREGERKEGYLIQGSKKSNRLTAGQRRESSHTALVGQKEKKTVGGQLLGSAWEKKNGSACVFWWSLSVLV